MQRKNLTVKKEKKTMADIRKLAPILLKWEAGALPQTTLEKQWEIARRKGFSNHPNDSGGATMCGITIGTYTRYRQLKGKRKPTVTDLKNITLSEWLDVLKVFYWDKMKADQIVNQSIANLCVDNVWGSGTGYIKQIQMVAGVAADGIVGPNTLRSINTQKPKMLFDKLWNRRKTFYNGLVISKPSYKVFLKGWMNRLNDFKYSDNL